MAIVQQALEFVVFIGKICICISKNSLASYIIVLFRLSACSSSVTYNCTYIQNPSYSSVYTTSGSCTYSVTPINTSICQLRLDFEKFVTGIGTTGACTDSFVVTGPSNSNGLQNLCGTLTGQHGECLYILNISRPMFTKFIGCKV